MRYLTGPVTLFVVFVLTGTGAAAAAQATLLLYRESEPGVDAAVARILVTDAHVRMDDGRVGSGFTLFDREQDVIYAVSDDDRSILVVDPPPGRPAPAGLVLDERVVVDTEAPPVAGLQPTNVALTANGHLCSEVVSVPGLLPEAVAALRDFHALLARAQQAVVDRIPASEQSDCDLAEFVYAPGRALAHGLPIREQRGSMLRELVDYRGQTEIEDNLFVVPAGYARMKMPGL